MRPDGRVDVVIGTQPSGQGHETSFAQVVADLLHVPVESVRIILGDTDVVRVGGGSHSGRSMRHAATVFAKAAVDLIAKGKAIAAVVMGTAPDNVAFADGRFASRETNRTFDFLELAEEAARHTLPAALEDGLAVVTDNEMHDPVFPNGCAICEVEVDPDTGEVDAHPLCQRRRRRPLHQSADRARTDPRRASPRGSARRCGSRCVSIRDTGQPLTGSLMDYGMPRADKLPSFTTEIVEVLSPTNPLGIKAGGEGGTTAGARGRRQRHPRRARASSACATSRCRRRHTRCGRRLRKPKAVPSQRPLILDEGGGARHSRCCAAAEASPCQD